MAWTRICTIDSLPPGGGMALHNKGKQVALFRPTAAAQIFATQNRCPHSDAEVLSRGLLGDAAGVHKVICPLHKCSYSLVDGSPLGCDHPPLSVYSTRIEEGHVYVDLPE